MPVTVNCSYCGKEIQKSPCYVERSEHLFCDNECKHAYQYGQQHPVWKQGAYTDGQGYIYISVDGQYVYEHRWVAEQMLGRPLESCEHVHHKDGDRKNNRWDNLEVLSHSEHSSKHSSGEGNPNSELTWEEVRRIREIYSNTSRYQKDIAEEFGVEQATISRIVRGDSWA